MKWYFQHIPGDSHDMDETFERILIDYDEKQSVFSMGKLGILWELDRASGAFTNAVDPRLPEHPRRRPRDRGRHLPRRHGLRGRRGALLLPSTGGFKSLRAMAYHPETTALYIPLNSTARPPRSAPSSAGSAGGGTGGVRGAAEPLHPDAPGQLGEFQALDIRTGETLWKHRRRAPYNTAALTTAGGLVFVGDWERYVFAYDAASGDQLWQSRLTTMSNGYPIRPTRSTASSTSPSAPAVPSAARAGRASSRTTCCRRCGIPGTATRSSCSRCRRRLRRRTAWTLQDWVGWGGAEGVGVRTGFDQECPRCRAVPRAGGRPAASGRGGRRTLSTGGPRRAGAGYPDASGARRPEDAVDRCVRSS